MTDLPVTHQEDAKIQAVLIYPSRYKYTDVLPYSHAILWTILHELDIPFNIHALFHEQNINKEIKKMCNSKNNEIWIRWIGTMYETLKDSVRLSFDIKNYSNGRSFTILWWSGVDDVRTRHMILDNNYWIDAINRWHAQPFMKFMQLLKETKDYTRDNLLWIAKISQLLVKWNEDVTIWLFPEIQNMPLVLNYNTQHRDCMTLRLPHYFNCPHNCNFCAYTYVKSNIFEKVLHAVTNKLKWPVTHIISEWPTFTKKIAESLLKITDVISEKQEFTPALSILTDPDQYLPENIETTLQYFENLNVNTIQIWVNTVDGNTAQLVWRKKRGRIKTEEELNKEIDSILHFLENPDVRIMRYKIDILLTPFDTVKTREKIINLYEKILEINKWDKYVSMFLSPLVPYPWTELYEEHKDKIDFWIAWENSLDFYEKLKSYIEYDPTIRKDDIWLPGVEFLKYFCAPFRTSHQLELIGEDQPKWEYLTYLAYKMTHEYIQKNGNISLTDFDIWEQYTSDQWVKEVYSSVLKSFSFNQPT